MARRKPRQGPSADIAAIAAHARFARMRILPILPVLALSACAELERLGERPGGGSSAPDPELEVAAVATPELAAPPPPRTATTVEQFDTTTEDQRDAASQAVEGGQLLGQTVASLGDPGRSGFWIETALAETQGRGRVEDPATGLSVEVELLPLSGDAGSRLSLAAMRVLEIGLTDLPRVDVYAF